MAADLASAAAKLVALAEHIDKDCAPTPVATDLKDAPAYLTPKETAKILGVTPAALSRWRYVGGGPKYIRIGRVVRYPLADLPKPSTR